MLLPGPIWRLGRARADDYYLAEGTGVADRYQVSRDEGVRLVGGLSGDAYEAWVQGMDPVTGLAKGRLRNDAGAVRFVEVVVNGPKSWSLAAELHPDIAAAYEAAQDRAAEQILGWLGEHATTRVGPRGGQVQVPVTELGGGGGAALHVAGGGSAPSFASAGQFAGVRGGEMARPAHRRGA